MLITTRTLKCNTKLGVALATESKALAPKTKISSEANPPTLAEEAIYTPRITPLAPIRSLET